MDLNLKNNMTKRRASSFELIKREGLVYVMLLKRMAEMPGANKEAVQDWKILSQWLGCVDGKVDETVRIKIGITWQSYLALGKSPSLDLEESFQQAKERAHQENWKTTSLPGIVRKILDRMLATDAEILKNNSSNEDVERKLERKRRLGDWFFWFALVMLIGGLVVVPQVINIIENPKDFVRTVMDFAQYLGMMIILLVVIFGLIWLNFAIFGDRDRLGRKRY